MFLGKDVEYKRAVQRNFDVVPLLLFCLFFSFSFFPIVAQDMKYLSEKEILIFFLAEKKLGKFQSDYH